MFIRFAAFIQLVVITFLIWSCEGQRVVISTVVDALSLKPVENATLTLQKSNKKSYSDKNGELRFDTGFTGMLFGGPNYQYTIDKEGYYPITGKEKWPADTIWIYPEISQNIKLHEYSWTLPSDTVVYPESILNTVTFTVKPSDELVNSCRWTFEPDSTLNFSLFNKYDGVFLKDKIHWTLEKNVLTIGESTFIILDINSSELTIRRILNDRKNTKEVPYR